MPFNCSFCGAEINIVDDEIYYPHVQYVYLWGIDPDSFVYVIKSFATNYFSKFVLILLINE